MNGKRIEAIEARQRERPTATPAQMIQADRDINYLLACVRELEAGLRGLLMENGHSAGCLGGNAVSLPCEPFCQAARAALAGGEPSVQ